MRLAVLSDIHSNVEALDAVLSNASADQVLVLGDIIGYGADPQAVIDRLRDVSSRMLAGNHDLALTGRFDLSWFNSVAAEAVRWTRNNVDESAYDYLATLEPVLRDDHRVYVHGSVCDPAAEYVRDVVSASASFAAETFTLCLYGHTHIPFVYDLVADKIDGAHVGDGRSLALEPGHRYMLNPGSVGQPRDNDPRASYMIIADGTVTWHRVSYDVAAAQRKIRAAGLPAMLADRLALGR